uniref:Uncharacterized protein n=2 Tax=Ignisphaera aggregans TaxID=334771 RepID=A0A7C5URU9_9CREN
MKALIMNVLILSSTYYLALLKASYLTFSRMVKVIDEVAEKICNNMLKELAQKAFGEIALKNVIKVKSYANKKVSK